MIDWSKYQVIGIAGLAGAGKNTVADLLKLEIRDRDVRFDSFASPIKIAVKEFFPLWSSSYIEDRQLKEQVDVSYGVSPRFVMQTLGATARAKFGHDVFVDALAQRLFTHQKENPDNKTITIITDIRYANEAKLIRELFRGIVVHVIDVNRVCQTSKWHRLLASVKHILFPVHESERGVQIEPGDVVLNNSKDGLEGLLSNLREADLVPIAPRNDFTVA